MGRERKKIGEERKGWVNTVREGENWWRKKGHKEDLGMKKTIEKEEKQRRVDEDRER